MPGRAMTVVPTVAKHTPSGTRASSSPSPSDFSGERSFFMSVSVKTNRRTPVTRRQGDKAYAVYRLTDPRSPSTLTIQRELFDAQFLPPALGGLERVQDRLLHAVALHVLDGGLRGAAGAGDLAAEVLRRVG